GNSKSAADVKIPGLAKDGDDRCLSADQFGYVRVLIHRVLRKAGCPEGGEARVFEIEALGALEEFFVFWIGARPATLDVVDTNFVQLRRNQQFVVNRERNRLALRAIPQRGIERKDFHKIPVPNPSVLSQLIA